MFETILYSMVQKRLSDRKIAPTRGNMLLESRTFTRIVLFVGFVAVIRIARTSTAHKLNVPRVLLPVFNNFAVNFTLEVTDGGCYKW